MVSFHHLIHIYVLIMVVLRGKEWIDISSSFSWIEWILVTALLLLLDSPFYDDPMLK